MKKSLILVLLLVAAASVQAVPYYGWQSEETVDAQTLGLWQWNASTGNAANTVSGGLSLYKYGAMGYGTGKFGNGTLCPGGTSSADYWQIAYDGGNGRNLDALGTDASLSVAVWIKPNTLPTLSSPRQMIVDKAYSHSPTAGYQLYLYNYQDTIYLKAAVGTTAGSAVTASVAVSLESGSWSHVAMVWDSADDTLKLYQDGQAIGGTLSSGSVYAPSIAGSTNQQLLRVGNRIGSSYGVFDGVIDDLKISESAVVYAVPEPATIAIFSLGMLAVFRKRK